MRLDVLRPPAPPRGFFVFGTPSLAPGLTLFSRDPGH
jgi:hypothetical protein